MLEMAFSRPKLLTPVHFIDVLYFQRLRQHSSCLFFSVEWSWYSAGVSGTPRVPSLEPVCTALRLSPSQTKFLWRMLSAEAHSQPSCTFLILSKAWTYTLRSAFTGLCPWELEEPSTVPRLGLFKSVFACYFSLHQSVHLCLKGALLMSDNSLHSSFSDLSLVISRLHL